MRVIGVDLDKTPLESFKKNVAAAGVEDVHTICKTIGTDDVEWPEENGRLVIHFSPCCQPFSRARSASPASPSAVSEGLRQIRLVLDLVVAKGYKRWTLEEVSHPQVLLLVQTYAAKHPKLVAVDVLDAVSYGCPSERRRLIASSPAVLQDLKSSVTTEFRAPKRAFEEAGIDPVSEFYRNGNASCAPRPISRPGFTVTASHPLVFCRPDRSLVRCMQPTESAALVGFPSGWLLPSGVGAAQKAVGNAVSPFLSLAIVMSELRAATDDDDVDTAVDAHHEDDFVTRKEVEEMIAAAVERALHDLTRSGPRE
jgi:site-specific DNA-cytosine methylase